MSSRKGLLACGLVQSGRSTAKRITLAITTRTTVRVKPDSPEMLRAVRAIERPLAYPAKLSVSFPEAQSILPAKSDWTLKTSSSVPPFKISTFEKSKVCPLAV